MEEELEFVRDNYQHMSAGSMAQMLGLSPPTVRAYMRRLGLTPDKDVLVKRRRDMLKEVWGVTLLSVREAALHFGVAPEVISRDIRDLGLPTVSDLRDEELRAKAQPFIDDGASPRDIMETIGVGVSWFSRNFPDYRWTQQQYASFHRYRRKLESITSL